MEREGPTKKRGAHLLEAAPALLIALCCAGSGGCSKCASDGSGVDPALLDQPPNVVLVVIDTLRADRLSQYGHDRPTSPAFDDLSAHSTRFERAYSPSSWTIPSVASLLSGLSPVRHRTIHRGDALSAEVRSLAEELRAAGYTTFGVSHNHNVSKKTDFDQGFGEFVDFEGSATSYPDISKMLGAVRRWHKRGRDQRPFFVYLQPMNCHGPYRVPRKHRGDLLGRQPRRGFKYYDKTMGDLMWHGKIENREKIDERYLESLNEQYDTAVRYTTDRIGRLLASLKRWKAYEESLIIVTSDHGEELYDHEGFSHGYTVHEEVVHVPLWIKMPHQQRPRTVSTPVTLMDLYPTVLEALGVEIDHFVDGQSLLSLLEPGPYLRHRFDNGDEPEPFQERPLFFLLDWPERGKHRAVRRERHKLIEVESHYSGRTDLRQLFDLRADPAERHNLIERNPALGAKLSEQLEAQWKIFSGGMLGAPKNVLGEMDEKVLRALGYMQ